MAEIFKDRFSCRASQYRQFRPCYPEALFIHLASLAPEHDAAWDCATGSGQSAAYLAKHFKQVYATDASAEQISHAIQECNIHYAVSPAHTTALPDRSIDLVTVAQAIHWFAGERFYREVRRILKNNGVIAAWAYHLPAVDPKTDRVIQRFYSDILGQFWEKEIAHIQSGYRDLYFPFPEIPSPAFTMTVNWTLHQLTGYLETWSALVSYRQAKRDNPVERIIPELLEAWGNPLSAKKIEWPIILKTGKIFRS